MVYIRSELSLPVYSTFSIRWVEQLRKPLARPVPRRLRTACGDMLYNAMELREKRLFEGRGAWGMPRRRVSPTSQAASNSSRGEQTYQRTVVSAVAAISEVATELRGNDYTLRVSAAKAWEFCGCETDR